MRNPRWLIVLAICLMMAGASGTVYACCTQGEGACINYPCSDGWACLTRISQRVGSEGTGNYADKGCGQIFTGSGTTCPWPGDPCNVGRAIGC